MPRAKNTDRAEARRRYRDQQRATEAPEGADLAVEATAPEPSASVGDAMRGSLRMPNVLEDLRALPGMFLRVRKLWIPVIALVVSFFLALALSLEVGSIPEGLRAAAALYVQLTLPPTALFVFFVGGFLAPRASYLVGGVLGILDGLLITLLLAVAPAATIDAASAGTTGSSPGPIETIGLAIVIGVVAGGFAAWYRNFLRQSQERARQNRIARDAEARTKAKEKERVAKEEQRKAAAAARQAGKGGSGS